MAEHDAEQDSLFKEIDEDLRHERYSKLWKNYGNYFIGGAVVLVAAVAGFQAFQTWNQNRLERDGDTFASALRAIQESRTDDASRLFSGLIEDGSRGYALLARLNASALLARNGDAAGAAAEYLKISEDSGVDRIYRGLALVLATLTEMDIGDPQTLIDRVQPLTQASDPWRHSAREISALLLRRKGDMTRAGQLFKELADDPTAPAGIRARAAELAAITGK